MAAGSAPAPAGASSSRLARLVPVAVWSAAAALLASRVAGWTPDDFYITYRYAQNLAHGHGFVFNPGQRVFGTTDPGLGLLLGALAYATRAPVPLLGTFVFSASLVGVAAVLLHAAWRRGFLLEAVLGGSLMLVSSYVWGNHGAAAPLALLLLLLAATLAERRPVAAGVLAGATVWVRPDAAVGTALLGLLLLGRGRRVPWRFAVPAACVIAAGIGLAWLYFGSPLPNTLGAKVDMASAAADPWSGLRFWRRAWMTSGRHFGAGWPAVILCGSLGAWPLATRAGRPGRLLALFGGALALAYPLLGVPFFSWYILPCLIAAIYGLAFFAGAVGAWLAGRARFRRGARTAVAAGLFLLLACTALQRSWWFFRGAAPVPHMISYRRGAEWIKAHSNATDSVAYVEIGVIGYYSERPILDLMGLVSPEARPYVLRNDLLGALRENPTELVLYHTRGRMGPIVKSRWFRRRYEEVVHFEDPGERREGILRIYRRRSRALTTRRAPGFSEHLAMHGGHV